MRPNNVAVGCLLPVLAAVLAGCAAPPAGTSEDAAPHGYVAGAEEIAEAQYRLVVADGDTGAVRVLDLGTEDVTEVGTVAGVGDIAGDGRFAYLTAADHSVHVVDGGAWMVDHGDHVHYYRAPAREVGPLPGAAPTAAHSDPAVVAVSYADGTVQLLDRVQLDAGVVAPTGRITGNPHQAHAVPHRGRVVSSVAQPGRPYADAVEVRGRQGELVAAIPAACPDLQGSALTRRGAVFGCADGALLVTEQDGAVTGVKIPYPQPVADADRAREFTLRPGSSTLAARAGDRGVWALDLADRSWTLVPTGPVVAWNAVGEGAPLLTLSADGVMHAYDPRTARETARTPLLGAPVAADGPAPTIQVDTARAYVNDPSRGTIYEIDYSDDLRTARTLTVPGRASLVVETGR